MRQLIDTIDITPTPTAYARMLLEIVKNSTKAEDIKWAENEIIKAFQAASQLNPDKWGKE